MASYKPYTPYNKNKDYDPEDRVFRASIQMLSERALDTTTGGGPETLVCIKCNVAFKENELIKGPNRRRGKAGEGPLPIRSPQFPNGYVKRYWHADCNKPFGFNTPTPQTNTTNGTGFSVTPGTSTGWQNGSNNNVETPTLPPNPQTQTQPTPETPADLDAFLKIILGAVSSVYDPKLDTLTATDNTQQSTLTYLATQVANQTATIANLKTELETLKVSMVNKVPVVIAVNSVVTGETNYVNVGVAHKQFPLLLATLRSLRDENNDPDNLNVWLAGPAGSGKTYAAKQVSKALFAGCECERCTDPAILKATGNAPHFYFTGAIDSPYKLSGFITAQGEFVSTAFYECWTKGGVFLFDEVDRSWAQALLAFNAPLSSGFADFPGAIGRVQRHENCYIIAAGNTWGLGNDNEYSGAAKIDAAFLSRFPNKLSWDYDNDLEHAIARHPDWVNAVQGVRARCREHGVKIVIDPRQSIAGATMLRNGLVSAAQIVENIFGTHARNPEIDNWTYLGAPLTAFLSSYTAS